MSKSVTNALPSSPREISLLLSDVNGTLVTKEKIFTDLFSSSATLMPRLLTLSHSCSHWQT